MPRQRRRQGPQLVAEELYEVATPEHAAATRLDFVLIGVVHGATLFCWNLGCCREMCLFY